MAEGTKPRVGFGKVNRTQQDTEEHKRIKRQYLRTVQFTSCTTALSRTDWNLTICAVYQPVLILLTSIRLLT
jgi:hypothetical protein